MTKAWPRMMKRKTAARYCDLAEAAFVREVMTGKLPGSVMFGGHEHWDRVAVDHALDALSRRKSSNWEDEFWNNGQAA